MLSVMIALAAAANPPPCLSADVAVQEGFTRKTLESEYVSAFELWPEDEDAVATAWQEFTRPLRQLNEAVSLTTYFSTNGSVDLVLVTGEGGHVERVCEVLGQLSSYTWPLQANRPFRQCGSVLNSASGGEGFGLTVEEATLDVCAGSPIPVTVTLENRGDTIHPVWLPRDGTLKDDVNISLVVEGEDVPDQLVDPTVAGMSVVVLESLEPGGKVKGTLDLAPYLLPSGETLGETPGEYILYADVLKQGGDGAWSGVVWSRPFEIVVRDCGQDGE